jgi:tRNA pseudouridine38-40 synthase
VSSFKLTIAYDGTGLVGWQRQAAGTSVQGLLEDAFAALDAAAVAVTGAGRTDAGVHALGQVASVTIRRSIDPESLVRALNARLPPSVRVVDAVGAPAAFHARFDARSKTYRYRIWTAEVLSPFERAYAWHVPGPLDVEAMARAALLFEGRHDFAAFRSLGTEQATTTRVVFSSRIDAAPPAHAAGVPPIGGGSLVVFEICGDGFLRHMVRSMAGTLVEVGRGRRPASAIAEMLAAGDRARGAPRAPAEGLFLVRVDYA